MLKGKNYCITKENLMAHEMIGLEAKIVQSSDSSRLASGLVVDETKNTFVLESSGKEILNFATEEPSLEDIYLRYIHGQNHL